jgi:hypothetical protein
LRLIRDSISEATAVSNLPYNFSRIFFFSLSTELAILEKEAQAKEDSILYKETLGKSLGELNMAREAIWLYLLLCNLEGLSWEKLSATTTISDLNSLSKRLLLKLSLVPLCR